MLPVGGNSVSITGLIVRSHSFGKVGGLVLIRGKGDDPTVVVWPDGSVEQPGRVEGVDLADNAVGGGGAAGEVFGVGSVQVLLKF